MGWCLSGSKRVRRRAVLILINHYRFQATTVVWMKSGRSAYVLVCDDDDNTALCFHFLTLFEATLHEHFKSRQSSSPLCRCVGVT